MLGGHTATLHEGRITQYGETAKIFRSPNTLVSARVFSDPPMNTARVSKQGDSFILADNIRWPVAEKYRRMADGEYTLGIHPHHLNLDHSRNQCITISGTIQVAEISGSESIVHVSIVGDPWVSESQGIHPFVVGETAELQMQTGRCLYFNDDGNLVAS